MYTHSIYIIIIIIIMMMMIISQLLITVGLACDAIHHLGDAGMRACSRTRARSPAHLKVVQLKLLTRRDVQVRPSDLESDASERSRRR